MMRENTEIFFFEKFYLLTVRLLLEACIGHIP